MEYRIDVLEYRIDVMEYRIDYIQYFLELPQSRAKVISHKLIFHP